MKELFNKLSNVFQFFNEKRFIYAKKQPSGGRSADIKGHRWEAVRGPEKTPETIKRDAYKKIAESKGVLSLLKEKGLGVEPLAGEKLKRAQERLEKRKKKKVEKKKVAEYIAKGKVEKRRKENIDKYTTEFAQGRLIDFKGDKKARRLHLKDLFSDEYLQVALSKKNPYHKDKAGKFAYVRKGKGNEYYFVGTDERVKIGTGDVVAPLERKTGIASAKKEEAKEAVAEKTLYEKVLNKLVLKKYQKGASELGKLVESVKVKGKPIPKWERIAGRNINAKQQRLDETRVKYIIDNFDECQTKLAKLSAKSKFRQALAEVVTTPKKAKASKKPSKKAVAQRMKFPTQYIRATKPKPREEYAGGDVRSVEEFKK